MEQKLKETEQDFKVSLEYIAILERYKYHIFTIAMVGLILSSLIAIKLPHMYKSTASILINQESMPDDIVKAMVTNYAEQRIQIINQKIMSSESLKKIINKFNLYSDEREKSSIHSIVNLMREDTHMDMIGGDQIIDPRSGKPIRPTIGFEISFDSQSPIIAQQIASELVNLYLSANIKQREGVIKGATKFLEQETNKLRNKVSMFETKLAKFKEKNAANLPDRNGMNLSRVNHIEQNLKEISNNISTLTWKAHHLKTQLSQLSPNTTSYNLKGERIYGVNDRLTALEAEYATLSSKYSKGHPDLVKIRREILSLQKDTSASGPIDKEDYYTDLDNKQEALAVLINRYSPDHPDIKNLKLEISNLKRIILQSEGIAREIIRRQPNNPIYIQLQTELLTTQSELNLLRKSRVAAKDKLLYYDEIMSKSPEVEREYQSLMRDYENATFKYREVKEKQMEATMAESMELITKGNEFFLLELPLVPEDPFKPNRKAIVFLGMLVSIAMAFGFVAVKESLNPSVYTSGRLASVIGMRPLVVIPHLETEKILLGKQKNIKIVSFIIGILLIVILWYVMLSGD